MRSKVTRLVAACVLGSATMMAIVPAQARDEQMKVIGSAKHETRAAPRSGTEVRSVVVRYADLDLADTTGAETLYGRLKIASRQVCSPYEDTRQLALAGHWKECYAGALDSAVAKVGDLRVAELHRAATGRDVGNEAQLAGTR